MNIEEIFPVVRKSIMDSCGLEEEKIHLNSTLFDELGIDSIDMVDILYTLENEYDIVLKVSDIDREARNELGEKPYELDGVITSEGLEAIRKRMPEIAPENLQAGITVHQIVKMITVQSLCNVVKDKLDRKQEA